MKKLVFSFGRFNPPTTGHEVLLKKVVAVAKKENADAMVYSSQSNDPKKNPLPYKEKTKFMKAMFPKHKKVIQYDVGVKNAFDTLSTVYAKGYRDVTMVVGSDRVTEFEKILNKYNDVKGKHGYYNFEGGVKVVSAGARDPDAEGVTGMSASKMRAAAAANDFESFAKGMPAGFKGGQSVFDAVRNGMNLSEEMMDFLGSDIKEFRTFINADIIEMLDDIDDEELFESIDEDFGAIPDFATMVAFGMAAKMSVDAVKILWRTARGANKIRKWAKRNGNKLRDTVNPAPNFTQFESTLLDEISKKKKDRYKDQAQKELPNVSRYADNYTDASKADPSNTMYKSRGDKYKKKALNRMKGIARANESVQNGLIGLDQIKKFESVVDKLFAKYNIDFNFTRHFGDRMDDSRNSPSITLKELAEFIKKMYKRQGKSIKGVAGAEAVLKDIQSDLNIPVAVTYDSNNDEFDVVLKTIMRKKNFTSPDKVIKYESTYVYGKIIKEVKQDSDVKDKKGTQPSKYFAADADGDKMSKSTKEKRAAYFAKGSSKKPAPGDSDAKTKESKHTKKYRKMFGETKPCWNGYVARGMKKKGDKMVPNCVPEETMNEAKIDGLVKKSEKSGISYGILKKVYDRGMAAWKSGHRPGTTAQQWAFARVNSFVTKGKGTWGKADKDLAAKVRSESFLPFNEKLDPNKDDMSDYVKDFKKSKAPQFKGKSDDKRKQMAVAAYLAAKEKTESVDEDRDYKKERENYLGTPEQMERNAARSRARRLAIKKGMAERGDGKDIHHKDNNPMNNDPKNLSSVTQKYNRSEPRKRNK